MPKPRATRKEQRRVARDTAQRRFAETVLALAAGASPSWPPHAQAAYRDECLRLIISALGRTRAHSLLLARADSGPPARSGEGESGA